MKPRLLDLFCGEGGAARGYAMAGFDVIGVDLFMECSQARYPHASYRADAIEYLADHGHEYDAIHASPPCQRHTAGTRAQDRSRYPDLIGPTRNLLAGLKAPWVIENVPGAPLENPITLCGTHFGLVATDDDGTKLYLRRHRLFESNVPIYPPGPCHHPAGAQWAGAYGGARRDKTEARHVRHGGYVPAAGVQAELMGIDGMTQRGLHQAIPPAYTEWIGRQLLDHLAHVAHERGPHPWPTESLASVSAT